MLQSIEIKSPEEDKNSTDHYPNWFDRNKFEEFLAIIDSNKFNYKNLQANLSILTQRLG